MQCCFAWKNEIKKIPQVQSILRVETPGRERYSCAPVDCSWKFFCSFCFETANRRRSLGPSSQEQSSVCIILWQLSSGPQTRATPRTNLKGTSGSYLHGIQRRERSHLILIMDSNASHCIVYNLKFERLSYFKLPWNSVSVFWIYLTFYLAFVLIFNKVYYCNHAHTV